MIKTIANRFALRQPIYRSARYLASSRKEWPTTTKLDFVDTHKTHPMFQVLDNQGAVLVPENEPQLSKDILLKIYKQMLQLNQMDVVLFDAQRQGRISFYMTSYGEEATHFGAAACLEADDVVLGQYREAGVLMWRGFTLDEFMNQCYSNDLDYGKGRQMPVHYGSKKLNFQTISSPLGTQIPQAAGAAYALKLQKKKNVSLCYFGEGAASEGDFHYALNFAQTIGSPTVFLCRNNGYAISTPASEQYSGDGIVSRGEGYGIKSLRVDGNDVLAVYQVMKKAREYAAQEGLPVLVECITYRVGHHSTSDDSSAYRSKDEVESYNRRDNPIVRFKRYLINKGHMKEEDDQVWKKEARKNVLEAFSKAEKRKKPSISEMFTDVYDKLPKHLQEQQKKSMELIKKYGQHYQLTDFKS